MSDVDDAAGGQEATPETQAAADPPTADATGAMQPAPDDEATSEDGVGDDAATCAANRRSDAVTDENPSRSDQSSGQKVTVVLPPITMIPRGRAQQGGAELVR